MTKGRDQKQCAFCFVIKGEQVVLQHMLLSPGSYNFTSSVALAYDKLPGYVNIISESFNVHLQRVIIFYDSSDTKKEEHIKKCLEVAKSIQKENELKLVTLIQVSPDSKPSNDMFDLKNVISQNVLIDTGHIQAEKSTIEDKAEKILKSQIPELRKQIQFLEDEQTWRDDFQSRIADIQTKAKDLKSRDHFVAAETAEKLAKNLTQSANIYFNDFTENGYEKFKTDCLKVIDDSKDELEKHRGWKRVLGNLAICIAAAVVFYPFVMVATKLATGRFFFFNQTDSVEKLEKTKDAVHRLKPSKP